MTTIDIATGFSVARVYEPIAERGQVGPQYEAFVWFPADCEDEAREFAATDPERYAVIENVPSPLIAAFL
jgi:hypothetical protein